jgi:NAD(P)-dependent dehydrogenase (short-subunit alcohol dehydrogenase family)
VIFNLIQGAAMKKLLDKVAVVTGAGSEVGIGKEVALALAAEGAKVVVNDISTGKDGIRGADKVVAIITGAGGTAVPNYDSITTMQGAGNVIQAAIRNFGRIDILVNTAANWVCKPVTETSEAEWDFIMSVQLKGLFGCTQAALKEMVKQKKGGRIINFISSAAFADSLGPGGAIAYSTAKAGVAGFTNALALEMNSYGITVNAISPWARTSLFPDDRTVNGVRVVGPEYIAPLVVYLATDAAKDVTGQFIFSSGGDIRVLERPFQNPEERHWAHKDGKWTVDELIEVMPKVLRDHKGR